MAIFHAISGCVSEADTGTAPDSGEPTEDWSLAGCVATSRFEFAGSYAGAIPRTCKIVFRDRSSLDSEYLWLSEDCRYDDGGFSVWSATYDDNDCPLSYDGHEESDGLLYDYSVTAECDERGEWLWSETAYESKESDGYRYSSASDTEYENDYDDDDRLVVQASTERQDSGYTWWSEERWTYEDDLLTRWDRDYEGEAGTSSWWTSREDYFWSNDLQTTSRTYWSDSSGDTGVYYFTENAYDESRRLMSEREDFDENGVVDYDFSWSYVGDGPGVAALTIDIYDDGIVDRSEAITYDCP